MPSSSDTVLALDVGERRIGVARAKLVTRLPHPLVTITRTEDDDGTQAVADLMKDHQAALLVVGLPRGLDGQETAQTRSVQAFGSALEARIGLSIHWQDEALTSAKAESELQARKKPYAKGDIDALAATYILEDFLYDHPEVQA